MYGTAMEQNIDPIEEAATDLEAAKEAKLVQFRTAYEALCQEHGCGMVPILTFVGPRATAGLRPTLLPSTPKG